MLSAYIVPALWDARATCLILRCWRSRGATSTKVEIRSERGTSVDPPKPGLERVSRVTWGSGSVFNEVFALNP